MQFREVVKPRRRTSLTPLIDVVFLLLVFFMLSSSFVQWRQVKLQAGASEAAPTIADDQDAKWITVSVQSCSDGGIFVDGRATHLTELTDVLRKASSAKGRASLVTDDSVSVACMVRVLDEIAAADIPATTVEGLIK